MNNIAASMTFVFIRIYSHQVLQYQVYNFHAQGLCIFYKLPNLFNSLAKSLCSQGKSILACQHYFLFLQRWFLFLCFTCYFGFNFVFCLFFFCLDLIWFLFVLVILFCSCCSFLLLGELVIISEFFWRQFIILTNLRTFNKSS